MFESLLSLSCDVIGLAAWGDLQLDSLVVEDLDHYEPISLLIQK